MIRTLSPSQWRVRNLSAFLALLFFFVAFGFDVFAQAHKATFSAEYLVEKVGDKSVLKVKSNNDGQYDIKLFDRQKRTEVLKKQVSLQKGVFSTVFESSQEWGVKLWSVK